MEQQIIKEEEAKNLKEMSLIDKKKKRTSRKLPKSVRVEEFPKLINEVPKKDFVARISFLLAYGSGLRISEVLRCLKEHFRKDSLFIPESKYGVERVVPIPKGWKDEFLDKLPLSKNSISTGSRKLQRKFKKYSKLAKLDPKYTFHSLRHGFATRCVENGIPLNQVQVLLGHSNISTTNVYVKANPIDAIKNYGELF